jgi:hypothetical protein
MLGDVETVRIRGQWVNVIHGGYDTQLEAAEEGKRIARLLGVEWFLRARSGRWRLRNTYPRRRDPRRSRG